MNGFTREPSAKAQEAMVVIYEVMQGFDLSADERMQLSSTALLANSRHLGGEAFEGYLDKLKVVRASNIDRIVADLDRH